MKTRQSDLSRRERDTSVALRKWVYLYAMRQSVVAPTFRSASADLKVSSTVNAFA
jgi:hypothetical protein